MKVKLDNGAIAPTRAHTTDAGLDLYAPNDFELPAAATAFIDTGVHIQLPPNTCGKIEGRSGLNRRYCIIAFGGVIDESYRGSIGVALHNLNAFHSVKFKRGDRIAQLLVVPVLYPEVEIVDELDPSERGNNGFGSTGR